MAMPKVSNLEIYYGVIQAVKGISFEVNEGEIVALIGVNGAGKTTILHTITGLIPSSVGKIHFEGKDITRTLGYKAVSMGMAHVSGGRRVFSQLSVYENLRLGTYTKKDKSEFGETLKVIYGRSSRLEGRRNQLAGTFSGDEQQMLAMDRALMSHSELVTMDESPVGLFPIYVNGTFDVVQGIDKAGATVPSVEQSIKKALSIADRAYVPKADQIVLSGDAEDLMSNDPVKKAYLSE